MLDPDRSLAAHAAEGDWAQAVTAAMSTGTPMKAPATPQRKLPKNTAKSTASGDSAKLAPAILGSGFGAKRCDGGPRGTVKIITGCGMLVPTRSTAQERRLGRPEFGIFGMVLGLSAPP